MPIRNDDNFHITVGITRGLGDKIELVKIHSEITFAKTMWELWDPDVIFFFLCNSLQKNIED